MILPAFFLGISPGLPSEVPSGIFFVISSCSFRDFYWNSPRNPPVISSGIFPEIPSGFSPWIPSLILPEIPFAISYSFYLGTPQMLLSWHPSRISPRMPSSISPRILVVFFPTFPPKSIQGFLPGIFRGLRNSFIDSSWKFLQELLPRFLPGFLH